MELVKEETFYEKTVQQILILANKRPCVRTSECFYAYDIRILNCVSQSFESHEHSRRQSFDGELKFITLYHTQ